MKAMFCEGTLDINLIVSLEEAVKLKRSKEATPVLEAEDKGLVFHLMNSDSPNYLEVKSRPNYPHYWIKLNSAAYEDLMREHTCGTRYQGPSKVNVHIQ